MEYKIELCGITKRFPAVLANDHISFAIKSGTIHAIIGENGAGKTTLMNILYGLIQPDEGEILLNGQKRIFQNALDAISCGIGMVHQHFMLIPRLCVADNIVLGIEPHSGILYRRRTAIQNVGAVCQEYGITVDPAALIRDISLGMRQRVEIVKALYRGAEVIILDEPTAILTPQEITDLGKILFQLKAKGKTILIITHKLEEVMEFSDEITVLRAGRHVVSVRKEDTTVEELTTYMVGRSVHLGGNKQQVAHTDTVLELQSASCRKHGRTALQSISLSVKGGEILGIAGIDGSGQTELTELIAGILPCASGSIALKGRDVTKESIAVRKALGIGFIAQDRHRHGLVLGFSVEENLMLGLQRRREYRKGLILNKKSMRMLAERRIQEFDIRPPYTTNRVSVLSGGNQQKVIVAREVGSKPELIVADQPTRGVDIGAIEAIHNTLVEHRNAGGAVVFASLELDEVLLLSDRIAVMCEGRLVGILNADEASREKIGLMMVGNVRPQEAEA